MTEIRVANEHSDDFKLYFKIGRVNGKEKLLWNIGNPKKQFYVYQTARTYRKYERGTLKDLEISNPNLENLIGKESEKLMKFPRLGELLLSYEDTHAINPSMNFIRVLESRDHGKIYGLTFTFEIEDGIVSYIPVPRTYHEIGSEIYTHITHREQEQNIDFYNKRIAQSETHYGEQQILKMLKATGNFLPVMNAIKKVGSTLKDEIFPSLSKEPKLKLV